MGEKKKKSKLRVFAENFKKDNYVLRTVKVLGMLGEVMIVIHVANVKKANDDIKNEQQVQERGVSAKRGTIYDSTGKYTLAVSSSVSSITVNPTNIAKENKAKLIFLLFTLSFYDFVQFLISTEMYKLANLSSSLEQRFEGCFTIYTALFYYYLLKERLLKH